MTPSSTMDLHGRALLDYLDGAEDAHYILCRDDGIAYPPICARQFFYEDGLPKLDTVAIQRCTGRVLDVGAGAGSHSLALQERGLDVTAVDISPRAVEVMTRRGVLDARTGDVYDTFGQAYDTVLVMLNIGIVQDLEGLDRFYQHLDALVAPGGQLITDSTDPRDPADGRYRQYQERKARQGKYYGERTLRFEYQGQRSDWFEWLHIDPDTLAWHADRAGWAMDTLATDGRRYLVSIRRQDER